MSCNCSSSFGSGVDPANSTTEQAFAAGHHTTTLILLTVKQFGQPFFTGCPTAWLFLLAVTQPGVFPYWLLNNWTTLIHMLSTTG